MFTGIGTRIKVDETFTFNVFEESSRFADQSSGYIKIEDDETKSTNCETGDCVDRINENLPEIKQELESEEFLTLQTVAIPVGEDYSRTVTATTSGLKIKCSSKGKGPPSQPDPSRKNSVIVQVVENCVLKSAISDFATPCSKLEEASTTSCSAPKNNEGGQSCKSVQNCEKSDETFDNSVAICVAATTNQRGEVLELPQPFSSPVDPPSENEMSVDSTKQCRPSTKIISCRYSQTLKGDKINGSITPWKYKVPVNAFPPVESEKISAQDQRVQKDKIVEDLISKRNIEASSKHSTPVEPILNDSLAAINTHSPKPLHNNMRNVLNKVQKNASSEPKSKTECTSHAVAKPLNVFPRNSKGVKRSAVAGPDVKNLKTSHHKNTNNYVNKANSFKVTEQNSSPHLHEVPKLSDIIVQVPLRLSEFMTRSINHLQPRKYVPEANLNSSRKQISDNDWAKNKRKRVELEQKDQVANGSHALLILDAKPPNQQENKTKASFPSIITLPSPCLPKTIKVVPVPQDVDSNSKQSEEIYRIVLCDKNSGALETTKVVGYKNPVGMSKSETKNVTAAHGDTIVSQLQFKYPVMNCENEKQGHVKTSVKKIEGVQKRATSASKEANAAPIEKSDSKQMRSISNALIYGRTYSVRKRVKTGHPQDPIRTPTTCGTGKKPAAVTTLGTKNVKVSAFNKEIKSNPVKLIISQKVSSPISIHSSVNTVEHRNHSLETDCHVLVTPDIDSILKFKEQKTALPATTSKRVVQRKTSAAVKMATNPPSCGRFAKSSPALPSQVTLTDTSEIISSVMSKSKTRIVDSNLFSKSKENTSAESISVPEGSLKKNLTSASQTTGKKIKSAVIDKPETRLTTSETAVHRSSNTSECSILLANSKTSNAVLPTHSQNGVERNSSFASKRGTKTIVGKTVLIDEVPLQVQLPLLSEIDGNIKSMTSGEVRTKLDGPKNSSGDSFQSGTLARIEPLTGKVRFRSKPLSSKRQKLDQSCTPKTVPTQISVQSKKDRTCNPRNQMKVEDFCQLSRKFQKSSQISSQNLTKKTCQAVAPNLNFVKRLETLPTAVPPYSDKNCKEIRKTSWKRTRRTMFQDGPKKVANEIQANGISRSKIEETLNSKNILLPIVKAQLLVASLKNVSLFKLPKDNQDKSKNSKSGQSEVEIFRISPNSMVDESLKIRPQVVISLSKRKSEKAETHQQIVSLSTHYH